MNPRLSGHSKFGLVFLVLKFLLGVAIQQSREKLAIFNQKPRSRDRILIYRTWATSNSVETIGAGFFQHSLANVYVLVLSLSK